MAPPGETPPPQLGVRAVLWGKGQRGGGRPQCGAWLSCGGAWWVLGRSGGPQSTLLGWVGAWGGASGWRWGGPCDAWRTSALYWGCQGSAGGGGSGGSMTLHRGVGAVLGGQHKAWGSGGLCSGGLRGSVHCRGGGASARCRGSAQHTGVSGLCGGSQRTAGHRRGGGGVQRNARGGCAWHCKELGGGVQCHVGLPTPQGV